MPWYVIATVLGLFACGWTFNARALANPRTPDSETARKLHVYGGFAPAMLFSERGWRFRKLAFLFYSLGLGVIVAWAVLT